MKPLKTKVSITLDVYLVEAIKNWLKKMIVLSASI